MLQLQCPWLDAVTSLACMQWTDVLLLAVKHIAQN